MNTITKQMAAQLSKQVAPLVTEKQAREARTFLVDWIEPEDAGKPNPPVSEQTFTDYLSARVFARKTANRIGSACLMPIIDGKRAACWTLSKQFPTYFDN